MKFSDIAGHQDIKRRLREMVDSDRIPHALLLEGPPGIGKFKMARALAQYIHCENRHDGEPCGKCPACLQHQSLNHIDTYFSYPVVKRKSGEATVSEDYAAEWRKFITDEPYMDFEQWLALIDNVNAKPVIYVSESDEIQRRLSFTARKSRYRIVLMWLPERMQPECANKLLKLIEEPYSGSIFIMVSNESAGILPTIYSRTQRITMQRLSDSDVASVLMSEYGIEAGAAADAATLGQGNINSARRQNPAEGKQGEHLQFFMSLMRLAYQRNVAELKKWSNEVAALGREQELVFIAYCQRMIRENFIYNINIPELRCLNAEELQFSSRFARFINNRNVLRIYDRFERASQDIAANGNPKIILFDLAVNIIMLIK